METIDEPPLSRAGVVVIGRNSRGNWIAQENNGLFGGLFVSRAQAFKYALFENDNHPETIVLTADIVELDMHRKVPVPSLATMDTDRSLRSSAA